MLEPIITEKLKSGATVTIQPKGTSMLPLIVQGKDEVVLKTPTKNLKKYDIIFYKRPSGQFVLHRIIKVRKNDFVLCGDNQTDYEYGITPNMVLAVAVEIIKNSKSVSVNDKEYLRYCKSQLIKIKYKRIKIKTKRLIKFILRIK